MNRYGMSHIPERSAAPADETPFVRASQVWDDRIGSARVQAASWRKACFGLIGITMLSVVGLIYQSAKASVIPYLVEVESTGRVRLVGKVTTQDWSLSESAKRRELEHWLRNLRAISSDQQILKERLTSVRTHATQAANLQLDRYFEQNNPFGVKDRTRTVHIEAVHQIPGSTQAYRVEWKEENFDEHGAALGVKRFVGEFHLSILPPTDDVMLEANPLGVYIAFFDLTSKR